MFFFCVFVFHRSYSGFEKLGDGSARRAEHEGGTSGATSFVAGLAAARNHGWEALFGVVYQADTPAMALIGEAITGVLSESMSWESGFNDVSGGPSGTVLIFRSRFLNVLWN